LSDDIILVKILLRSPTTLFGTGYPGLCLKQLDSRVGSEVSSAFWVWGVYERSEQENLVWGLCEQENLGLGGKARKASKIIWGLGDVRAR
jgi:hypothetical protein